MNDVSHLCWFDQSLLSNIPNIVFLCPADCAEYLAMARWALDQTEHPVVIRVPAGRVKNLGIPVADDYSDLNTYVQVREGSRLAIVAAGHMLETALKAADVIEAKYGFKPTVINPRFTSGIDAEMLSSLSPDHTAVITVEDALLDGGMGQKIAAFYGNRTMLVRTLGLPKEFLDRYNAAEVAAAAHLTVDGIVEEASLLI